MTVGILTEKPSAARKFAQALGGMSGSYKGESYVITSALGHLYEFKDPAQMVAPAMSEHYSSWELGNLPWDHGDFSWEREVRKDGKGKALKDPVAAIKKTLSACDEIVIATDTDPSGEGQLIAWEIIDELGLHGKKITRATFLDEAEASIRKAVEDRSALPKMAQDPEFRKADLRSKYDLLTMQFTRVATKCANSGAVLRQGRLKSAMVALVGDGIKAHEDYKKVPFFENRFKDENGVVYTDPEAERFAQRADVPGGLSASDVVQDSVTDKTTSPPKLLDLAGLSSILSGKGIKAKDVLKVYQAMYEAQIVSYPRTEDKTVTPEQFNELLPKVDAIAKVVGVDPALLTHRKARKTHVKPQGAHGANRPGLVVPASLESLGSKYGKAAPLIYEILAKNYLSILAPDYEYEQHKGHVKDHPAYVGTVNIPKSLGYKAIFSVDEDEDEVDTGAKGLGTRAEPFVHEGFPPRPPHPSMKWLMAQLEKREVGTGATRTTIYADVTNESTKYPLLLEKGRKLTMSEFGAMSYHLIVGTNIGDLGMTERLFADMREVAAGTKAADDVLAQVAPMVAADIETMKSNAITMRKELGMSEVVEKERFTGHWNGEAVKFAREWGGHRFTDAECEALCAGEEISFEATSKAGKAYVARGQLAKQEYKGREFVGFKLDTDSPPASWAQHVFTDAETKTLKEGGSVQVDDCVSAKGNTFSASLRFAEEGGRKKIVPTFSSGGIPKTFCKHEFTTEERTALENGETIYVDDFVSKKGKSFAANVEYGVKPGESDKSLILKFD